MAYNGLRLGEGREFMIVSPQLLLIRITKL